MSDKNKQSVQQTKKSVVQENYTIVLSQHLFSLIARKPFQPFFRVLHKFSLAGMNYGGGGDVSASGEVNVFRVISQLTTSPVVFDVGASVGDYTATCKAFFPGARVYSFEPSSSAFLKLSARFKDESIQLFNLALGSEVGKSVLYSDKKGSGFGSLYKRQLKHTKIVFTQEETIQLQTVDQISDKLRVKHIDLLKLDVEGYELSVLKGAEKMLNSGKIKFIQFEFGGCDIDSRTFFKDFYYLLTPKYDIFRIVQDGLFRMNGYREVDEIFVTTNYLAVLRG